MIVYSYREKFEKVSNFYPDYDENTKELMYIICDKKLFRRPKIINTNIKLRKNLVYEDRTVMRYGIKWDNYIDDICCNIYQHETPFIAFHNMQQLLDALMEFKKLDLIDLESSQFMKRKKINLKYIFRHIEVAVVEVPRHNFMVPAFWKIYKMIPFNIIKGFKVYKIVKIVPYEDFLNS